MNREKNTTTPSISGFLEKEINEISKKYPGRDSSVSVDTLTALRDGDHNAFDEVYLHFITPVTSFLKVLLRNEEDAKEIAQEVFMKVWENRAKLDPGKNIKGFIYTFARFYAMNYFDRKKVRDKYSSFASHLPEEYMSVDEVVIGKETALLVEMVLRRMPSQREKVFRMSRNEGMSNDQIAESLNISKRTVETHISAAIKDIKEVITLLISVFMI